MVGVVVWMGVGVAGAQALPDAPGKGTAKPTAYYGDFDWLYRAGVVCGGGASISSVANKPSVQCGGILGLAFFELEAGAMGPTVDHDAVSGYLSTNFWVPITPSKFPNSKHGAPIVIGGYTQRFGASNALSFGAAYALRVDQSHAVQFEARDYWTYASPGQHNVVFRVAWLGCMSDP
jgi:hypothetical protein